MQMFGSCFFHLPKKMFVSKSVVMYFFVHSRIPCHLKREEREIINENSRNGRKTDVQKQSGYLRINQTIFFCQFPSFYSFFLSCCTRRKTMIIVFASVSMRWKFTKSVFCYDNRIDAKWCSFAQCRNIKWDACSSHTRRQHQKRQNKRWTFEKKKTHKKIYYVLEKSSETIFEKHGKVVNGKRVECALSGAKISIWMKWK